MKRSVKAKKGDFTGQHYEGDFYCASDSTTPARERLLSLEGSPKSVSGNFDCGYNDLESLVGGPKHVGGDYSCTINNLKSLEGAPVYVGGEFSCYNNRKTLESLEGAPRYVGGDFTVYYNPKLNSFEGAPDYVGGEFFCDQEASAGENLYIMTYALFNGHEGDEEYMLETILKYFLDD